jgi:Flp pilus assembly pilin Flp
MLATVKIRLSDEQKSLKIVDIKAGPMIYLYLRSFCRDERGQDFIEYALMAALMCVSMGVVMPGWIYPQISHIFSGVTSSLIAATSAS